MAFKKPAEKRSIPGKSDVRVKNSYYTFSKEYPVGNIGKKRRSVRKRNSKKIVFKAIAAVLCFVVIMAAAYFSVELCLKISYKKADDSQIAGVQVDETEKQKPLITTDGIRAFTVNAQRLGDMKYIKKMIRLTKRRDCNCMVIDFKTSDGHLIYSSNIKTAMVAKCAMYDNETIAKTISYIQSKKIKIIAGIYCFEDNLVASSNKKLAVKYMNSDVTWLDGMNDNDGKAWLNPYSKTARSYIIKVIAEVQKFGVSGFILKSANFPSRGAVAAAGYPGEKNKNERNSVLLSFIDDVKAKIPASSFVIVSQSAKDTLNANKTYLFGSLNKCSANGICVDTNDRPSGYVVDRKTKFSSILSLLVKLKGSLDEKKEFVPVIDSEEYTPKYLRTITKNGYKNFIVYDENGEY